jgi:hypothetical protein
LEKMKKIQSTLYKFYPPAPTAKVVAKLDPGLRRFAQVRGWASAGKEVFPAFSDEAELVLKKKEFLDLMDTHQYDEAKRVDEEIKGLKNAANSKQEEIATAMTVLTESKIAYRLERSSEKMDFPVLKQWHETMEASKQVLSGFLEYLEEKEEEARRKSKGRRNPVVSPAEDIDIGEEGSQEEFQEELGSNEGSREESNEATDVENPFAAPERHG